jgi:hypothetical protein
MMITTDCALLCIFFVKIKLQSGNLLQVVGNCGDFDLTLRS